MIAQSTALRKFPGHNIGKRSPHRGHQTPRVEEKELKVQKDQESSRHRAEDQRGESCTKGELQRLAEGPLQVFIRVFIGQCM